MGVATGAEGDGDGTLLTAVVDVLDAGQKIVLDRIDLAWIEGRATATALATALVLALLGLAFLLVGWCALNACVVLLLAGVLTTAQSLGLVAGVNFAVAAVALVLARRRADTSTGSERAVDHAPGEMPTRGESIDDATLRRRDRSPARIARA